jgi:hypothetical protein
VTECEEVVGVMLLFRMCLPQHWVRGNFLDEFPKYDVIILLGDFSTELRERRHFQTDHWE